MFLSESDIIDRIKKKFSGDNNTLIGIGDDAALVKDLLITQDLLLEGIHFSLDYFSPEALAHKALHVNLSDIAAMGGVPKYVLLALGIPTKITKAWLDIFLDSFTQLCLDHQLIIVGGDTTAAPHDLVINVTVMGQPSASIKTRAHAKVGDVLCVTGNLGDSGAGLIVYQKAFSEFTDLKHAHCYPQAKIAEGQWLAEQECVHAMMDLSDGLWLDLPKLCEASEVGAIIEIEKIPISKALVELAKQIKQNAEHLAIQGGEDYELLITADHETFPVLQKDYEKKFKKKLILIGYITTNPLSTPVFMGIRYMLHGKLVDLHLQPFTHFDGPRLP